MRIGACEMEKGGIRRKDARNKRKASFAGLVCLKLSIYRLYKSVVSLPAARILLMETLHAVICEIEYP